MVTSSASTAEVAPVSAIGAPTDKRVATSADVLSVTRVMRSTVDVTLP
jgi:hypothetical protein